MLRSKPLQALIAVVIALAGAEFAARLVVAEWAILDVFTIDPAGKPPCYRLKPGSEAIYEGWVRPIEATTLRINAESLRGPPIDVKPDQRPRLALVGDSHVFGLGVGFPDTLGMQLIDPIGTLPGRVTQTVSRAEVLNFGVPGYDFTGMVARVEEDVARFCPDAVAVFLCADDLQVPRCGRYADARSSPLRRLALGRLWMESRRDKRPKTGLAAPLPARDVAALVARVRAAIGPRPALTFVNLCRPELPEHASALAAAVSATDASIVDVTDEFTRISFALGETAIRYDGHLNAAGNKAFADLLAPSLRAVIERGLQRRATTPDTCAPRSAPSTPQTSASPP